MTDKALEKVVLEEVAGSARRIIIRLDIGPFAVSGPADNIIEVESRVAFSATLNELYREGYEMVAPEDYAAAYGVTLEEVHARVTEAGSLFLLFFAGSEERLEAVPLEVKVVTGDLGPHLVWM